VLLAFRVPSPSMSAVSCPHESTGDQFYGEDQFECYRRLGKDIAASMLKQLGTHADIISAANKLLVRYERRPRWRRAIRNAPV
jgi:hypothetical protein